MMYSFKPLDEAGIQLYRSWFEDETVRRRISYPDKNWVKYVTENDHVFVWTIWQEANCLGILQADVEVATAYFVIIMNPIFRSQGYCKNIIIAFMDLEEMKNVAVFEAFIENDNVASLKCHAAAGFEEIGKDNEFLHLQRKSTVIKVPMH